MRRAATCLSGLLLGVVASVDVARGEIGAGDVIAPTVRRDIADCVRNAPHSAAELACFGRPGVSAPAYELARALQAPARFGRVGILEEFFETGDVDLAGVFFPTFANTNFQTVLVNGADGPVAVSDLNFTRHPARTPATMALLRQYPQAFESGRVSVLAMRVLPDGGQRFVLADIVTDGCRACAIVASSLSYVDFRDGRQTGTLRLGWMPWSEETLDQAADLLRRADIRTLQMRLNVLGYHAGPEDGIAGAKTTAALHSFKRDHCLPPDGSNSEELVSLLTQEPLDFSAAPCAQTGARAAALPVNPGQYVVDPRLCPPVSIDTQVEFGDRAYELSLSLRDGTMARGEGVCSIGSVSGAGGEWNLALDCVVEGRPEQRDFVMSVLDPDGFVHAGRVFRRCAGG